jgi:hypothetical protein
MFAHHWFSLLAVSGILVFFAGCGSKLPDDLPKLYPAQIEITAGDEKLAGAIVTLSLIGGGGESVGGGTDAEGIAKLYTRGLYAGAPIGKYKVCVNWTVMDTGATGQKSVPTAPVALKKSNEQAERDVIGRSGLEPWYGDRKKTPLDIEIVEGNNSFSVKVKKLDNLPGN